MTTPSREVNYWYGELISSMLLCNHNNPGSNDALRKCLFKYVQRCPIKPMQSVAWFAMTDPMTWLEEKIKAIEEKHEVDLFMFLQFCSTGRKECLVYYSLPS